MKKYLLSILIFLIPFYLFSQNNKYQYGSPLDIPLALSANFGELRPNHFHSGLDFRTQSVVNKSVYSIEEGYISRIGINVGGYGLVLYIEHPKTGQVSVYAHLNSFSDKIAQLVKEEQYKREQYAINIENIPSDKLPVKKGEFIAKSGNTGSSGGPHVHFEIRDAKTQNTIDPLPYYIDEIKDDVSPEIRGIAVYPLEGKGIVNGKVITPFRENLPIKADRSYPPLKSKVEAWGKIGIGIYTIDRMTNTSFSYGVKEVRLYCDDKEIFYSDISLVYFSTSKMINTLVDFNYWKRNKRFYMKSFIEPGNTLHIYDIDKKGYVNIDQERDYRFRYELKDVHGNISNYSFSVTGKKRDIPNLPLCSLAMKWDQDNVYMDDDFRIEVPREHLYRDINLTLEKEDNTSFYSKKYKTNTSYEPLNKPANILLSIQNDSLIEKRQYGAVSIDNKGKASWIGGTYQEGKFSLQISELGVQVAVSADMESPEITPIGKAEWTKNKKIVIKITDNLSGIKFFKGTIDGKFALFEHDIKSSNYTYRFDSERLKEGSHELEFVAVDKVGNETGYKTTFTY